MATRPITQAAAFAGHPLADRPSADRPLATVPR
jgi:hypothetical protein